LVSEIPTLSPTWSLSVEEQYYLVWPALLMLLSKRLVIPVLSLFIVGNVAIMTGWIWTPEPITTGPLIFQMPNATYAPILMGSLAAIILHNRATFQKISRFLSHWAAPLIGFVSLILAMEFLPTDLRGVPNFIIHSIMTLSLMTLVIKERNLFSPILTNRIIARVGAVSYGIYLYHLLALDVTNRVFAVFELSSPWLVLIGYAILSYLIAEVSFRTLEAYFLRFRPPPRSSLQRSGRPHLSGPS
jgi:peptidoglycan/LPS O-acetylase OafA/YrhL